MPALWFRVQNGTFTTPIRRAPLVPKPEYNDREVAGRYYAGSGYSRGFVYSNGTFTTLDPPGHLDRCWSINDSGQVAGHL